MHNIDKFAGEAEKIVVRATAPGGIGLKKALEELVRLFDSWTRSLGSLGGLFSRYWLDTYGERFLKSKENQIFALRWLESALAFLLEDFSDDMNFPDEDWIELREIINAEADSLDVDFLMSIMSVFVARKKM